MPFPFSYGKTGPTTLPDLAENQNFKMSVIRLNLRGSFATVVKSGTNLVGSSAVAAWLLINYCEAYQCLSSF